MASVTWNDGSDNWTTAADWSSAAVPGASDDVTVSAGDPQITADAGSIASLTLGADGSVSIEGGALSVTGAVTMPGYLGVGDQSGVGASSFTVGGALTNTGLMNIGNGAGNGGNAVTVTVGSFHNEGSIPNSDGGTYGQLSLYSSPTNNDVSLNVQSAAGFGVAHTLMGVVTLQYNSQIQFEGGQITTIAANSDLSLYGADAAISNNGTDTNSALSGLTTVSGQLDVLGGASVATGGAPVTAGAFTVGNDVSVSGYLDVDTVIIASGGDLNISGGFTFNNSLTIDAGGKLEFGASGGEQAGYTAPINFAGGASGAATLQVDGAPSNGQTGYQTLVDFGQHDALYLSGMTYAPGATATLSGGVLTVSSNGVTENFDVTDPGASSFQVTDDAGGVLVAPVCFTSGTLIRTSHGEVAVENLSPGDLAVTATGEARPIVWIGHKRLERPAQSEWPVRVMAGAFGENQPRQDLLLSPGHAVCVDVMGEVFVPIEKLINGVTVVQEQTSDVTYWHVELASHDVLLAAGLPCESYMDAGNRAFFGRQYGRLQAVDPERVAESLSRYARLFVDGGPIVDAIRERLSARVEALVPACEPVRNSSHAA